MVLPRLSTDQSEESSCHARGCENPTVVGNSTAERPVMCRKARTGRNFGEGESSQDDEGLERRPMTSTGPLGVRDSQHPMEGSRLL